MRAVTDVALQTIAFKLQVLPNDFSEDKTVFKYFSDGNAKLDTSADRRKWLINISQLPFFANIQADAGLP